MSQTEGLGDWCISLLTFFWDECSFDFNKEFDNKYKIFKNSVTVVYVCVCYCTHFSRPFNCKNEKTDLIKNTGSTL